ncbi:MAG: aminopeptidase N [Halieaceae bacterium]
MCDGLTSSQSPGPTRLRDYQPFPFLIPQIELRLELDPQLTRVSSRLVVQRAPDADPQAELRLDARKLHLESIAIDGRPLQEQEYRLDASGLCLSGLPDRCEIEIVHTLSPVENQSDEGLFQRGRQLATQCESEGFRRITFFPDRPDVLSRYRVTLVADAQRYPVLLSNGHPVAKGVLPEDGRSWVTWEDPYPKPSYIFALVAGDFACLRDSYETASGRRVALAIYADQERGDELEFSMGALKRALRWEEEKYGREYDLDIYNIVALEGYVGAMENKGLNIFDANGICADPHISTDNDYLVIERILAHEVFHNWTGNRVTCRDWFQLSLKEGLTRFRDQCFAQDMSLGSVKRIEFVRALERNQFPEDDGPAAHPIKPVEYQEIRNFYTGTIYDKGAEVIRMLHCLLGDELFRNAVQYYLDKFDLQAVRTEDFIAAIAEFSGRDLDQFYRWYSRAGRPVLTAQGSYDAASRSYALTLQQSNPKSAQPEDEEPLHIPVLMGLLDAEGAPLQAHCADAKPVHGSLLLELRETSQTFLFTEVASPPQPSLLRGFSAPVSLHYGNTPQQLAQLMACDSDDYNRWRAGQQFATAEIRNLASQWHRGEELQANPRFLRAWGQVLGDADASHALIAEMLLLPEEPALSEGLARIDIDGHEAARNHLLYLLADQHGVALLSCYHALEQKGGHKFSDWAIGARRLRNRCLEIMLAGPQLAARDLCLTQINNARNMTDEFAALAALCHIDCEQRRQGLEDFYARWQHKPPVIDKWFNAQALSRMPGAIDAILELEQHPAMQLTNLPRAMAFYGGFFRQNRVAFNDPSGRGYQMLAERLIMIDSFNPGSSYWLMPQLLQWRRFDERRSGLMRAALQFVSDADTSDGLREIVSKALTEE